jgi:hypothetical protein
VTYAYVWHSYIDLGALVREMAPYTMIVALRLRRLWRTSSTTRVQVVGAD